MQWRWERARDEDPSISNEPIRTDCIVTIVPDSKMLDFSIVIKIGYAAGGKIVEYMQYDDYSQRIISPSEE